MKRMTARALPRPRSNCTNDCAYISFATTWVTIHDTATDGTTAFDAFTAAKNAGATALKRPENGVFRPGTDFREFYYTETGDTSATSAA